MQLHSRCNGEKLVEHVLRVILGLDLREEVEVLAENVFRSLVILLLEVSDLARLNPWILLTS